VCSGPTALYTIPKHGNPFWSNLLALLNEGSLIPNILMSKEKVLEFIREYIERSVDDIFKRLRYS